MKTYFLAKLIVVFAFAAGAVAAGQTEIVLYSFTNGSDGRYPYSNLILDSSGNLYGTAQGAGAFNSGVVFELMPNSGGGWSESVLYNFTGGTDGGQPYAGLVFDGEGDLYGTTSVGGAHNLGVVFELTPDLSGGWTESVLYTFSGLKDGASPFAGLTFDLAGNLYGTAVDGGTYDHGAVFKLAPSLGGWTESTLYSFSGRDGENPYGGVTLDRAGNIYGMTYYGGRHGYGVVYELSLGSSGGWTQTVLHNFTGGKDGGNPYADLTLDAGGNLYGTTSSGHTSGYGVVFELIPSSSGTWTEKVLHSFTGGRDGTSPSSTLIFDAAGNLYGTAEFGGARGYGVVFELAISSGGIWRQTVLHSFTSKDGFEPLAGLVLDAAGNLYSTTILGGTDGYGVVFEVTP